MRHCAGRRSSPSGRRSDDMQLAASSSRGTVRRRIERRGPSNVDTDARSPARRRTRTGRGRRPTERRRRSARGSGKRRRARSTGTRRGRRSRRPRPARRGTLRADWTPDQTVRHSTGTEHGQLFPLSPRSAGVAAKDPAETTTWTKGVTAATPRLRLRPRRAALAAARSCSSTRVAPALRPRSPWPQPARPPLPPSPSRPPRRTRRTRECPRREPPSTSAARCPSRCC